MNNAFRQVYRVDPDVVTRDILGDLILVPVRRNVADLQSIFRLNETAGSIWKMLDGRRTLEEIRAGLVEAYAVDEAQVGQDLLETVAKLEKAGVILKA